AVPDASTLLPYEEGGVAAESATASGVTVSLGVPVCRSGSAWVQPQWTSITASMRTASDEWIAIPCAPASCGALTLTIPVAEFSAVGDPVLFVKAEAHEDGGVVAVARVPRFLREVMLSE